MSLLVRLLKREPPGFHPGVRTGHRFSLRRCNSFLLNAYGFSQTPKSRYRDCSLKGNRNSLSSFGLFTRRADNWNKYKLFKENSQEFVTLSHYSETHGLGAASPAFLHGKTNVFPTPFFPVGSQLLESKNRLDGDFYWSCDPTGNRTPILTLKTWCPNR